jgi:hypothetical protein
LLNAASATKKSLIAKRAARCPRGSFFTTVCDELFRY